MFDVSPCLPCAALFLDVGNALLLNKSDRDVGKFQRIGFAKFVKSEESLDECSRKYGDGNICLDAGTPGVIEVGERRTTSNNYLVQHLGEIVKYHFKVQRTD